MNKTETFVFTFILNVAIFTYTTHIDFILTCWVSTLQLLEQLMSMDNKHRKFQTDFLSDQPSICSVF